MIGGFNFRTDVSDIMSDNIPDVKESTLLYPQRLTNGYKLTTQKISWFSRSLSKILDNKQALPMKCYHFTSWKEMFSSKRKKNYSYFGYILIWKFHGGFFQSGVASFLNLLLSLLNPCVNISAQNKDQSGISNFITADVTSALFDDGQ